MKNLRRLYVSDCDKIDDRALALVAKTWPYLEGNFFFLHYLCIKILQVSKSRNAH